MMITADKAQKISDKCDTWNIVERQIMYINTWIEGSARLGQSKCVWLVPDDFTSVEIKYVVQSLRVRGFEVSKSDGPRLYTILW